MRNRSMNPGRDGNASDTLERLQEALGALEARVGTRSSQPVHRPRHDEFAAIRARKSALDGEAERANALREEIGRLRHDVERRMAASPAGFNELRDELRAMRTGSGETGQLRAEIEHLKTAVTKLAREDSIRELTDRWSVVEKEIATLPQTLASRDDLADLGGRLDKVHDTLRSLPDHWHTGDIENQLRMLATAVEQLASQAMHPAAVQFDGVEDRLDEISRAIATLSVPAAPAPAVGIDAIERLEARIAALGRQLDEERRPLELPPMPDYRDHLNAIMARIEHLAKSDARRNETQAVSGVPAELIDGFAGRLDDIALAVEEIANMRMQGAGQEMAGVLPDLEGRIDAIATQLSASAENSRRSTEGVLRSIDERMEELARRIDETARDQAGVPSIASLEQRLEEIAGLLSASPSPAIQPAGLDLDRLEQRLADMASGFTPAGAPAIDEEAIIAAARSAAEEVVARIGASGMDMPAGLGELAADLRALEDLARDTDTRNARTFEAIHDTLLKVVDHLSSLEESVAGIGEPVRHVAPPAAAPAVAAPAPAPAMAPAKMHVPDAPSIQTELTNLLNQSAPSPAEAAANAAFAALHSEAAMDRPVAPPKPREKASILQSVTRRLSRGASRTDGPATSPNSAQMLDEPGAVPVIEDLPIEPGTDQMALADIMARVRAERAAPRDQQAAARGQRAGEGDVGRSDFIAAARRAAKAAAADATVADRSTGRNRGAKGEGKGRRLSFGRKPLLMGAGVILLALLALPLVRGFLAPAPVQTSMEISEPAPVIAPAPVADEARLATDNVPAVVATGETELAEAPDTAPDLAAPADPVDEAIDVPATETALAVPAEAGPPALRDAAAAGDPKALYVVAENLTAASGGASGDLGAALEWYERSAELGFAPAQYRAGNFHEKGFGAPRDVESAKTWYQLAAEQGNASAMHNLAVLFAAGVEGEPDFDSAARWFMRAAELGVRDSQFNLGILAAKGQGLPQDLAESYKWFALAAKSGDTDAAAKRDEVAAVMRPDQLEMARGAVELWRAKPVEEDVNTVVVPDEWRTDAARTATASPLSEGDMKKAVRNIQAILNANGYDAGPVDGAMGAKTRAAIRAFQEANGLPVTGDVDQALGEKLLELAKSGT